MCKKLISCFKSKKKLLSEFLVSNMVDKKINGSIILKFNKYISRIENLILKYE